MPRLACGYCQIDEHFDILSRSIPLARSGVCAEMGECANASQVFEPIVECVAVDMMDVMTALNPAVSSSPHRPMKVAVLITGANRGDVVAAL